MGGSDFLEHLDAGASLIVGTSNGHGEPRATRAWAAHIVEPEPLLIRVVVTADDPVTVANLSPGGSVAVTGCDVRTLRSVQVKGRVRSIAPADAADLAIVADHSRKFLEAVRDTDRAAIEMVARILPRTFVGVEIEVDQRFDQSPGPVAGRLLEA